MLSAHERKETIELVLGMFNTGASYLLVSKNQLETLLKARKVLGRPDHGHPASDYVCLSPIVFHSTEELRAKLKTYEQSARKKRRAGSFEQDTSAANKMFVQSNPARAQFELQRRAKLLPPQPLRLGSQISLVTDCFGPLFKNLLTSLNLASPSFLSGFHPHL